MSYVINPNLELEYIHITFSDTVTFDERKKAKAEVISLCFDNNFHRSLIDLRESNVQMSKSDVVKFASSFKNTALPENYRIACVVSTNNQSENLIEIIISQDGINVKYFLNFKDAQDWLTSV